MFEDFRIFGVGMAAVIDTALLFTLLERRNWRYLTAPIAILALGGWLFHTGAFIQLMLVDGSGRWLPTVQWLSAMATAAGLVLMPSALLHGIMRYWRTGFDVPSASRRRYFFVYLPLVVLLPVAGWFWNDPAGSFMKVVSPLVLPFVVWMVAVNLGSAIAMLILRRRFQQSEYRKFCLSMAIVLFVLSTLLTITFGFSWPGGQKYLTVAVTIAPLMPALVFAVFVVRYNFMRFMLEQTMVYAAIVAGVLLFHRLVVGDMTDALGRRYGVDFGVIEGLLICALVLVYRPLRERTSEALRYLMGSRVDDVRLRTRQLAVELSRHAEDPPQQLLDWFVHSAAHALAAPFVAGWLFPEDQPPRLSVSESVEIPDSAARELLRRLEAHELQACNRRASPNAAFLDLLKDCDAGLAVRLTAHQQKGLFLFGHRRFRPGLGEEETNGIVLLIEQFGVTLHNRELRHQALDAERRALQNEKLSTMGLVASCLAHEVKNPLSSIKTIATVMSEQLGPESSHRDDLRLVLGEVERLTVCTNQLLGFARPADPEQQCHSLTDVLEATVRFLSHVAKQHSVEIHTQFDGERVSLPADENAVREIAFNILRNSMEAAGEGGRVDVACHRNGRTAVATFTDNGPGIAPEIQDTLFEPFATTKGQGTGLGLYIVRRRVQELGGEIRCQTAAGKGTTFTIEFPVAE